MSRADDLIERLQSEIAKRDARIDELEAQAGDGTSSNKYRAELSALKAGYGEAVAFAQGNLVDIFEDSTVSVIRREADDSYTLPLYLAPPTATDAVSVPDEFHCESKPLQNLLNATAMLLESPCPDSATYWGAALAEVESLLAQHEVKS